MSDKLSVTGDEDGWQVFGKTPKGGQQSLFRSRAGWPPVREYAIENQMMRVRCVLRPDQVRDDGMPRSTKDLDEYEDRLLGVLAVAEAEVYLIASVTGEGNRDLFFADPPVLSRSHLPALVGTSREMTGRVLRQLEREGMVARVGRNGLRLLRPDRLDAEESLHETHTGAAT